MFRSVKSILQILPLYMPILTGLFLLPWSWKNAVEEKSLQDAFKLVQQQHVDEAIVEMDKTDGLTQDDILVGAKIWLISSGHDVNWLNYLKHGDRELVADPIIQSIEQKYKQSLLKDSENDVFWHNLAWSEWVQGRHQDAIVAINRAIKLEPEDPSYRVSAGMFYEAAGNVDGAVPEYAKSLEISPRILESQFYSDLRARNSTLADTVLKSVISSLQQQLPDPIAEANLSRINYDLGHRSEAESMLRDSLKQLPNLGGAWLTLGMLESDSGQSKSANDSLGKAAYLLRKSSSNSVYSFTVGADNSKWRSYFIPVESSHVRRIRSQYWTENPFASDLLPRDLFAYLNPKFQ